MPELCPPPPFEIYKYTPLSTNKLDVVNFANEVIHLSRFVGLSVSKITPVHVLSNS